jgi:hypothetical protein
MTIHLDVRYRTPHATYPDPARKRACPKAWIPIWSCSRWGLPCHHRYRQCGALLPHPFTLTQHAGRFAFCGTFPRVAPAGCYPAPCSRGARTFLPLAQTKERPSGRLARGQCGASSRLGQAGLGGCTRIKLPPGSNFPQVQTSETRWASSQSRRASSPIPSAPPPTAWAW